MATIACWFESLAPAREAVLDLLTSGFPQEDISVIIGAQHDAPADGDTGAGSRPPDFVESLAGAGTLALSDLGPVIAAGPLAGALAGGSSLSDALADAGLANEHAETYAEKLRRGEVLIAARSAAAWDAIARGVFHHNADPTLRAHEEPAGPTSESNLLAADVGGPVSTSIGALSGGMVPGDWGAAGAIFEDQAEATEEDARRREGGMAPRRDGA
jgi:hypothetical protein